MNAEARPGRPVGAAGRTALVTGAGNGLGRAIALALAAEGARVICVGRTAKTLEETVSLIPPGSPPGRAVTADIGREDAVDELARAVSGEDVSILVNNAGIAGPVRPLPEVERHEWDEVFRVNVRSVYLMCRAFIPPMAQAGGGDIINIASVTGKRPLAHRAPYAASKMAVIGLTRTLAFECGPLGIAVNSLSPGPARGPRMERNFALEAAQSGITAAGAEREFVSRAALVRLVEPDEVGAAVTAMLRMPGLCGADIDLSAGMIAP